MVEVMKIMVTSFKRSYVPIAALSAADPAPGHHQSMPLPETPRHSWASLGQSFVGSLLLSPGPHNFLFVPSQSLFPQSCRSSVIKSNWSQYIMGNAELDEAQAGIKIVGEISITSDMQMTLSLQQKAKN